jgi:hypothetical protein
MSLEKAVEYLLARGHLPILYWLKKDILCVPADRELKNLEKYGARIRILEEQLPDGSWREKRASGPSVRASGPPTSPEVLTLQNVCRLYDFACDAETAGLRNAVHFLLGTQSRDGCFRAGTNEDYPLTFHALNLEILCRFGFDGDPRVEKGFRWLLRQGRGKGEWLASRNRLDAKKPIGPTGDKTLFWAGMTLRALSVSPSRSGQKEAQRLGEWLQVRLLKPDVSPDPLAKSSWLEISYPFWSAGLLSNLDTLSRIGFKADRVNIRKGLGWLLRQQRPEGYWESTRTRGTAEDHLWTTLAVLRVFKAYGLLK